MATIHDLSRQLNLSIGTISRALNNRPDVNAATRARVLKAARAMNYAPNQAGRTLRRGRTGTVAFLMSPHPELQYAQPFFFVAVAAAQAVFASRGLQLAIVLGEPGDAQRTQLRRIVESRWVDAILLASTVPHDSRIAYLMESGIPFATLGRSETGGDTVPALDADYAGAGEAACARLLEAGHERVATIRTTERLTYHRHFAAGCRRAFARAGVVQREEFVVEGVPSEAGGHAIMSKLLALADPPTAAVFVSVAMVPGAYRAIRERGLRVGDDVAVIAASDSPLCDYLQPRLTSFRIDLEQIGRRWAEILLECWPDQTPEPRIVREVLPMQLIARESDVRS